MPSVSPFQMQLNPSTDGLPDAAVTIRFGALGAGSKSSPASVVLLLLQPLFCMRACSKAAA